MYSLGLVCLGQTDAIPPRRGTFPFDVDTGWGVYSHRGDTSAFFPLFRHMSGSTYHVGFWENPDYFSAWNVLESTNGNPSGRRHRVRIRDQYRLGVRMLLSDLIQSSPTGTSLVFVDIQGLSDSFSLLSFRDDEGFWKYHDRQGLAEGFLYAVAQR